MAESLASTRVSASMGLPTGHVIEDAAAEGLGRAKANSMDPFDELLRQLRMFHQGEVQRLREEVLSLQSQRLSTDMQAPAFLQKQTDAEVMAMAEAVAESQGMNNHGEKEGESGLPTSLHSAASIQKRTRSFADSNNQENEKGWELGKSKHVSNIRAKKSASVLDQVHKKQSQSSWRPGPEGWLSKGVGVSAHRELFLGADRTAELFACKWSQHYQSMSAARKDLAERTGQHNRIFPCTCFSLQVGR